MAYRIVDKSEREALIELVKMQEEAQRDISPLVITDSSPEGMKLIRDNAIRAVKMQEESQQHNQNPIEDMYKNKGGFFYPI